MSNDNGSSNPRFPNGTSFSEMSDGNDDPLLLSVASYNLLAPVYVRPHDKRTGGIQPFAAFEWISDKDSEDVLGMERRGPRLLASLRSCRADVVCLQELQLERDDGDDHSFVLPLWIRPIVEEEGYQLCLPPKEVLETIAERNVRVLDADAAVTCAILFRTDRLVAIPEQEEKKGNRDVDTNTSVSICLKGKAGSLMESSMRPVVVTSVHLNATDETKRVGQLSRCLRRARNLQNNDTTTTLWEPLSTIVAGDMNQECYPGSCISAFLLDSLETEASDADMEQQCASALRLDDEVPTKEQLKEWNQLYTESQHTVRDYCVSLRRMDTGTTRSAYDHGGGAAKQVDPKPMGQWRLDHILYTPSTLRPCAYWSTLEDDPESCTIGLPNNRHGSDHIPIGALFRVQPIPPLSEEERKSLLDRLKQVVNDQWKELREKEASLEKERASIEAQLPQPPKEDTDEICNTKKKKKKKKAQEIMDFTRKKRFIFKELKHKLKEERQALVETLGDRERLLIAQEFGYSSARQWVMGGLATIQ